MRAKGALQIKKGWCASARQTSGTHSHTSRPPGPRRGAWQPASAPQRRHRAPAWHERGQALRARSCPHPHLALGLRPHAARLSAGNTRRKSDVSGNTTLARRVPRGQQQPYRLPHPLRACSCLHSRYTPNGHTDCPSLGTGRKNAGPLRRDPAPATLRQGCTELGVRRRHLRVVRRHSCRAARRGSGVAALDVEKAGGGILKAPQDESVWRVRRQHGHLW
jgi:hypothetical protein